MLRYSLFLIGLGAFIAGAITSALPDNAAATAVAGRNETVVYKNQAFPVFGPLEFEDCVTDDCSDSEIPGVDV